MLTAGQCLPLRLNFPEELFAERFDLAAGGGHFGLKFAAPGFPLVVARRLCALFGCQFGQALIELRLPFSELLSTGLQLFGGERRFVFAALQLGFALGDLTLPVL